MLFSKRAVSPVVATVLIVLLTIVVAGIVAQVVITFTNTELTRSKECIAYRDYFTFEESFRYTCVEGLLHGFTIKAATVSEEVDQIGGFSIVFVKDASSKAVRIENGQAAIQSAGGVWMIDNTTAAITLPRQGEVTTYIYNATQVYTKATVHPVLISGRICDASDTITLPRCTLVDLTP